MGLGRPIAEGSRSTVHAWGRDAVAKVPLPSTPDAWIRHEAAFCAAAGRAGAPSPEFLGFEQHDGRSISIYRRARGVEMWDDIRARPERAVEHGRRLWAIQRDLAALVPPVGLPRQVDRVRAKLRRVARDVDRKLAAVREAIPAGAAAVLCHGDLHPSNVILTSDGPVVVDWLDASIGDVLGDVARSTILLTGEPDHLQLNGGTADDSLSSFRRAYRAAAAEELGHTEEAFARWRAVMAVARIAEGFPAAAMLEIWHAWSGSAGADVVE